MRYLKKYLLILKGRKQLPIPCCHQIPANFIKWRAGGGRLAPPRLPDLITFVVGKLGRSPHYTICRLGISTNARSENDTTLGISGTTPKKLKSHNFVIETDYYRHDCFVFFSLRDISTVSIATMSIFQHRVRVDPALSSIEQFDVVGVNLIELFGGEKKSKIKIVRTGWNSQSARLVIQASRNN